MLVPTLLLAFMALISARSVSQAPEEIICDGWDCPGQPKPSHGFVCDTWECLNFYQGDENQKTDPRPADQKAPVERWNDPAPPVENLKPVIHDPVHKLPVPVAPVDPKKAPRQPAVAPKDPKPVVIIPVAEKPKELPQN